MVSFEAQRICLFFLSKNSFLKINLLLFFWLCGVFIPAHGLPRVVASEGCSVAVVSSPVPELRL